MKPNSDFSGRSRSLTEILQNSTLNHVVHGLDPGRRIVETRYEPKVSATGRDEVAPLTVSDLIDRLQAVRRKPWAKHGYACRPRFAEPPQRVVRVRLQPHLPAEPRLKRNGHLRRWPAHDGPQSLGGGVAV